MTAFGIVSFLREFRFDVGGRAPLPGYTVRKPGWSGSVIVTLSATDRAFGGTTAPTTCRCRVAPALILTPPSLGRRVSSRRVEATSTYSAWPALPNQPITSTMTCDCCEA